MDIWSEYGNKDQEFLSEKLQENWLNWFAEYNLVLEEDKMPQDDRIKTMRENNPIFNLRNYLMQEAIEESRKGDFSKMKILLELCQSPFDRALTSKHPEFFKLPPDWARNLCLSCSS